MPVAPAAAPPLAASTLGVCSAALRSPSSPRSAVRLLRHRRRPQARPRGGPFAQLLRFDLDTMQNALGNLAQVIAAVLGIVITVVSIVVQLAATRYTPRVADMFFRDRTNLGVMGFFVVACVVGVWVQLSVGARDFVPRVDRAHDVLVTSSACSDGAVLRLRVRLPRARERRRAHRARRRWPRAAPRAAPTRGERRRVAARRRGARGARAAHRHRGQRDLAEGQDHRVRRDRRARATCVVELPRQEEARRRRVVRDRRGAAREPRLRRAGRRVARRPREQRTWLEWKVLRQYPSIYNEALGDDARHQPPHRDRHALRRRGRARARRPRGRSSWR